MSQLPPDGLGDGLGFDPLDDALGQALRDAAPTPGDPGSTLVALRPRFERARRRRRAAIAGASTLAVLALGGLAFVVLPPGSGGKVETPPATRPDAPTTTVAPTPSPTAPKTVPTVPTSGSTGAGGTTATTDDHGGSSGSGSSGSGSSGSGSSGSGSSGSGSSGGHGSSGDSGTSGKGSSDGDSGGG